MFMGPDRGLSIVALMSSALPQNIGRLRETGHVRETVKAEMRRNLLSRLRAGEPLPALAERIQVGLLNIMEEKDVQIRGYRVRLPLDLFVIASANREDYTSGVRIITPLKDRFGSQVRTHYPLSVGEEMQIMESERHPVPEDFELIFPSFMKEIVAELTHLARRSPHISQSSGVSVRMSIANFENLASNAVRRAARVGETLAVPRITDLEFLASSTAGRVEIEALDEGKEEQVLSRLERGAISAVFSRHFSAAQFDGVVARFEEGSMLEVGEGIPARTYARTFGDLPELATALKKLNLPDRPEVRASVIEFLLEGLHLNKRLNKDEIDGRAIYRRYLNAGRPTTPRTPPRLPRPGRPPPAQPPRGSPACPTHGGSA